MLLSKRSWLIAVAESCTAGGLAHAITSVPGASSWFSGGFITYHNQAKMDLLGIEQDSLERFGAVSAQVAVQMANATLELCKSDISLSISGIAGPCGGSDQKPIGTVYFGLATCQGPAEWRMQRFDGGRTNVRNCAIYFALEWLIAVSSTV